MHVLDLTRHPIPPRAGVASTHGLGLDAVLELARVLGRLPRQLVLYGIEAAQRPSETVSIPDLPHPLAEGDAALGPSPAVLAAVAAVVSRLATP